jgi:hypothetical protein
MLNIRSMVDVLLFKDGAGMGEDENMFINSA